MEAVMEEVEVHVVALEQIESFVEDMSRKYPQHRLSVGSVCNQDPLGNVVNTYKIFTCYMGTSARATSESYWLGAFRHLRFDPSVHLRIRQWIESLDRKVSKGLIRSVA